MKANETIARLNHAKDRPADAFRRLKRRLILKIGGIDLSKQTELQYLEIENFDSKILKKRLISEAKELSLGAELSFKHAFESKFQVEISNVIVNTENNLIYILHSQSKEFLLLKESSEWPSDRNIITSEKPPRGQLPIIEYAKLGLASSGFFHLITEDLTAMLLNTSDWPTLNYKGNSNLVSQILHNSKLQTIVSPKWVKVHNLSFVSRGYDLGYLHPSGLLTLKSYLEDCSSNSKAKENIYVSRVGARRSILGEEKIVEHLRSKNFRIVKAEDYTFSEQLEIFGNANILIGVHGAGLTHGIWSADSMLIELMPINRINRCFEWQTLMLGNNYQRILYEADKPDIESIIKKLDSLIH
jgi:hypothetical protein